MRLMKKALTLMETLVATCVATMLLLEVGSSFLMFRQMNNESRTDAKNELKVLEIKDYITSNVDKFIDEALGYTYFRVDYDEIDKNNNNRWNFVYDGGIYILKKGVVGNDTVTLDTVLENYTINHESIISFKLPEDYRGQPIYLNTKDGNKQVVKLSSGDALYYSKLVDKGIEETDINIAKNVAKYENNSLYINGEQIFTDLPFKNVTIKLGFEHQDIDTYTVAEVREGLKTKYELLPFTIEVNDPKLGMVTIEDVDINNHKATLAAHSFYKNSIIEYIDRKNAGEEVDINEAIAEIGEFVGDVGEIMEGIKEGKIPNIFDIEVYKFDGWEGTDNKDFTYEVDYLDLGKDRKVVANFLPDTIDVKIDQENEDIADMEEIAKYLLHAKDGGMKNTTVTKKVYVLKCTIEYEDKNGAITTLPFTAGLFEKYLPEIYRGEN